MGLSWHQSWGSWADLGSKMRGLGPIWVPSWRPKFLQKSIWRRSDRFFFWWSSWVAMLTAILYRFGSDLIPKPSQNPSQIDQKSSEDQPKTTPNREKYVLGAFSAPNRAQVGPRTLTLTRPTSPLGAFLARNVAQGLIFGPWKIENCSKITLLGIDGRLGPPKMASGRGFGKT